MACARVPLDEQQVTEPGPSGQEHTLPALHPVRKEERCFVPYKPPPEDGSPAQLEEFLEHAKFITEDLDWLLTLPHDKFWCQVVFDESLQKCLDSYLHHAPRSLDLTTLPSSSVADMQRSIHRAVFLTFLRMATHKESKDNFITPAVFGEIIYDNFLFDIPKILDLCVLFGKGNGQLLHKMIENIFTQQPSYYSDLEETVPTVLQVRSAFQTALKLNSEQLDTFYSHQLKVSQIYALVLLSTSGELADLILYLCDSTTTIHAFLDIFPAACSTFHSYSFLSRLSSFYETVVPELEKAVRKRNFDDKSLREDLWKRLSHSCRKMVEMAHLLLHHTCLQPILEGGENVQTCAEEVLQHFTSFLTEKRFVCDYDEQFNIADDVSLLQQAVPVIDETRTSYLLQGVQSAWDSAGRRKPQSHVGHEHVANQGGADFASAAASSSFKVAGEEEVMGAEALVCVPQRGNNGTVCSLSGAEVDSLLFAIKDLLPDLGDGFLLACLQEYNYNSEMVINNILEDRLPAALNKLDRAMPRPVTEDLPDLLNNRSSVFDDDEFDVFRRDQVDMSRIWKGKRKGESTQEMLNDKQHIAEQRARYQTYETVVDEILIEPGESSAAYGLDDYDDEYDDTYDMNQVGANDLDRDSLLNRRPFTVPQVLRKGTQVEDDEEEEDEEEPIPNNVNRDQFVQDPALLRERAEARRAAIHQRKGFRPERPSNVVGKPKGQGQTLETALDRRKKEASKSRTSNHSRRTMADRKRNKGMIPS
uniref:Activating signal cointegrator 1 complex subunit 2 n=1 Tax=Takifugu rubripes TaxID=31033 RepID=A0A674N7A2_TAKRU